MKWLWVSVVVLLLDQCTKLLADAMLVLHQQVAVIPYLALFKAYNPGAAFSFLGDASGWQRWFFIVIAIIVIVVLLVWLRRLTAAEKATSLALALILGGAAGNLIDRLVYGYVIDFIDVYYRDKHWPTFNVADSLLCIGVGLLIVSTFLTEKSPQKHAPQHK